METQTRSQQIQRTKTNYYVQTHTHTHSQLITLNMISIIHRLAIIVVVVGYIIIFYIFQLGFFFSSGSGERKNFGNGSN
jgi:hypothetical protein